MTDSLADAITWGAGQLGVNPVDLATTMSYETGGTFDPWQKGPVTKYGQHRGLIQWGEPQRAKYGVYQGMSNHAQLASVVSYMKDAGVKPGMGLEDIYSAINAGHVGKYDAVDNGTTVAQKVASMGGHREKAEELLAGRISPQQLSSAAGEVNTPLGQPDTASGTPTPLGMDYASPDQDWAIKPDGTTDQDVSTMQLIKDAWVSSTVARGRGLTCLLSITSPRLPMAWTMRMRRPLFGQSRSFSSG